jgi:hypothetical protein
VRITGRSPERQQSQGAVPHATTKITGAHTDRLLPCQASRTSLRRSHRSRKQNQPGLRRLRSERYQYQWGLPLGPLARRGRVDLWGPAVLVVRVRRRVRLGLGHQLAPAVPAARLVQAVRKDQLLPARRRGLEDQRALVGLERPGGRPDQRGQEGQPHHQALGDFAVPCKPPTQTSRWQKKWSPAVASAFHTSEGSTLRWHVDSGQATKIDDYFTSRGL